MYEDKKRVTFENICYLLSSHYPGETNAVCPKSFQARLAFGFRFEQIPTSTHFKK